MCRQAEDHNVCIEIESHITLFSRSTWIAAWIESAELAAQIKRQESLSNNDNDAKKNVD